jgi:hypothetical protein
MNKPTQALLASMRSKNRAMSTTVGLGIAVAIIAVVAVVGVFVLDIGGMGDSGADVSIEPTEETVTIKRAEDSTGIRVKNLTRVGLTHDGCESLSLNSVRIAHEGETSVWSRKNGAQTLDSSTIWDTNLLASPQPDLCAAGGSGDDGWTSGQTNYALVSGGSEYRDLGQNDRDPLPNHAQLNCQGTFLLQIGDNYIEIRRAASGGGENDVYAASKVLMAGDTIEVQWQSASGDGQETLLEYTVQSDSPDYS